MLRRPPSSNLCRNWFLARSRGLAGRCCERSRLTLGHQFRDFLLYPQDQRRLSTTLSREEVSRLINAAGTLFRRTPLMTLYGTGMRFSELAHLKMGDIDSRLMMIRVVEGKRGKAHDTSNRSSCSSVARRSPLFSQFVQDAAPRIDSNFSSRQATLNTFSRGMMMSPDARLMCGLSLILIPTIVYGG